MEQQFEIEEDHIITNYSYLFSSAGPPELPDESAGHNEAIAVDRRILPERLPIESAVGCEREISLIDETNSSENDKYLALTTRISKLLNTHNEIERNALRKKLKGHFGVYETGKPWIDMRAVCLLKFYPLIDEQKTLQDLPEQPSLQATIKLALSEGRYVPIQHILHALHLSQFNPQIETYPLSLTQIVPFDFIEKINRSDVLRGINVHALFLGANFPIIGAQFASIRENFWNFMFKRRYSAKAGMEFYNKIFFEFTCRLGNCEVVPLDEIYSSFEEKVTAKFVPSI